MSLLRSGAVISPDNERRQLLAGSALFFAARDAELSLAFERHDLLIRAVRVFGAIVQLASRAFALRQTRELAFEQIQVVLLDVDHDRLARGFFLRGIALFLGFVHC